MKGSLAPMLVIGLLYVLTVYPILAHVCEGWISRTIYVTLLVLTLGTWWRVASTSPGSPHPQQTDALPADQVTYCAKCKDFRPLGSHHCRVCQHCVLDFDHHCIWTGNCIGQRNKTAFRQYVAATTCLTGWVTACIAWPSPCTELSTPTLSCILYHASLLFDPQADWQEGSVALVFFIAGGFALATTVLAGFHCYLEQRGLTTYDVITRGRSSWTRPDY